MAAQKKTALVVKTCLPQFSHLQMMARPPLPLSKRYYDYNMRCGF